MPLIRLTSTSALFLALLLPVAPAFADTTEDPLARALLAFADGKYKEVVELAGTVPASSDNAARAHYLAGEAQLLLAQASNAEASFRAVLKKNPKAVPAIVGLGRALKAQGKLDEAEAQYQAALKLEKKDAEALRALGELELQRDAASKKALKTLRAARKAAPKDPQSARALVEAYLRQGKDKAADKKAESVARKQIKATPKHPMGHFLRGLVLERRKKDDDAIAAYEKAIALDDAFLDAHKNLAILCLTDNPTYQDRKRTAKAMKHFERYFELGGKDKGLEQSYRQIKGYLDQAGR